MTTRRFIYTLRSSKHFQPHYVSRLKSHMQRIHPTLLQTAPIVMYQVDLLQLHVFVRHDAVKKPLQAPYDGPYSVIKRDNKFFTMNVNGSKDTVSINTGD